MDALITTNIFVIKVIKKNKKIRNSQNAKKSFIRSVFFFWNNHHHA